jgi:AraC-like DNA-binding protein
MKIEIKSLFPDSPIAHFIHSFWMLENKTKNDIPSTVLPNGMVDLIVMKVNSQEWEMVIRGIDTMSDEVSILSGTKMFSIGFKLLAVEYLFKDSIKDILNEGKIITTEYWQFDEMDLINLESFCSKATQIINTIATQTIDTRKKKLFEHIYATDGSMSVKELSEKVFWSSRQINRYFNQTFGISLKTYCNILRFGASFKPISEGKIFPEQNFTDQNHFIKEIKKYAGVTPKELSKNKEDRFLNITAIKSLPI